MSDIGWRADGIARAGAAGGVLIERYTRPGFTGGPSVRALPVSLAGGSGFEVWSDPEPDDYDMEVVTGLVNEDGTVRMVIRQED